MGRRGGVDARRPRLRPRDETPSEGRGPLSRIDARAEEGFTRGAQAYERGRPGYAEAAVAFLVERLGLRAGATVVDLASGTGKLARLLVPSAARVVAVEPVEAMRSLIPEGIEALDGTAEAIPLADGSADAVTVAQAFHWFRAGEALAEIHRVLRDGGTLAVVRNERDPADAPQRSFAGVLARHRAHRSLESQLDLDAELARSGLFEPPARRAFPHAQELDAGTLLAHAASHTPVSLLAPQERERALAEFRALAESLPPRFALGWVTDVATSRAVQAPFR